MWTCSRASAEQVGTEASPQLRQKWEMPPEQKHGAHPKALLLASSQSLAPGLLKAGEYGQQLAGKASWLPPVCLPGKQHNQLQLLPKSSS